MDETYDFDVDLLDTGWLVSVRHDEWSILREYLYIKKSVMKTLNSQREQVVIL